MTDLKNEWLVFVQMHGFSEPKSFRGFRETHARFINGRLQTVNENYLS